MSGNNSTRALRYCIDLQESSHHFRKVTRRNGTFFNKQNLTIQKLILQCKKCRYLQIERQIITPTTSLR